MTQWPAWSKISWPLTTTSWWTTGQTPFKCTVKDPSCPTPAKTSTVWPTSKKNLKAYPSKASRYLQLDFESFLAGRRKIISYFCTYLSNIPYRPGFDFFRLFWLADAVESRINSQYDVDNFDAHPLGNSVLIHTTGRLLMDQKDNFFFSQSFVLTPKSEGGYYINNDIFRLIY